ncbi:acyltransferase [Kitasatospora terrestris]|uniref:Acyltransferase 3 domain-containing protein n=1 Tax=Kitasatospora terrestris TaxID=258051 RepID=A0ABP9DK51_9ACTN
MTTTPPHRRFDRLPSLSGLRWFAALLVFTTHFVHLELSKGSPLQDVLDTVLTRTGLAGVSAFFLLSGFVLTWSARPSDTARSFLRRRFARVYPSHLLVAGLAALLMAGGGLLPGPKPILANLLLVQSWSPSQTYSLSLNPVTWSLSCEIFFYLVFPLVIGAMNRARTSSLQVFTGASFLATLVLPAIVGRLFTVAHPPAEELVDTSGYGGPFTGWFANVFPGMRLLEFLAGVSIAILVRRGAWPRIPAGWAFAILAAGYANELWLDGYLQLVGGVEIPVAILIASLAQADLAGSWSPVRGRRAAKLGELTYAFYLVHFLVLIGLGSAVKPLAVALGATADRDAPVPVWLLLAAYPVLLAVALGLGWAVHRGVEQPIMRVLTRGRRKTGTGRTELVPLRVDTTALSGGADGPGATGTGPEREKPAPIGI